ncbi:MAG: hypothetical protein OEX77_04430 [Candidatus Bathyarchaeota archaeon]|nr:hypothetical protein [Candidatus Bathyarchaeota archaeon]MDH5733047.1 hypothetical protein [Candidatus Bathyarchaeota archaeon]
MARLKLLLAAMVCGFVASLGTGTISSGSGIGIPEINHYGYPLAWLVTNLNGPTEYVLTNLVIDAAFWITVSFVTFVFLEKIAFPSLGIVMNRKTLLLLVVLFIPLGLVMDIAHEAGHALWGSVVGGKLTYMKIAYLEIYPQLVLTSEFQLGLARVEDLPYASFAHGLMLMGGSMTTNIASWIIALVLLNVSLGNKIQIALKFLGLFGILDLPFYVVFPQVGLGHWIFLGGACGPEPLTGARMIGIPDPAFYGIVALSTLGLVLLYSKTLRESAWTRIGALLHS